MGEKFSPTMRAAIDHALLHDATLVRFPGGFWSHKEWKLHQGNWWGTSTIEAIVKRGAGEYSEWQEGKRGKFPIEMKVTL